jgi:hypothetical protein
MNQILPATPARPALKSGWLKSGLMVGFTVAIASSLTTLVLTGCSTATLIGASVDMASFVPAIARTKTLPLPALTLQPFKPLDDKDGNPNNGFLIETPISSISIIEGFNAEIELALSTTSQSSVKLELFIAPASEVNIYQAKYVVTSDDKTIAANGSETVSLKFDLQPNSAASDASAIIKAGKFRLGLNLGVQAQTLGTFTFTLNKAIAGVSGYPAKIITK